MNNKIFSRLFVCLAIVIFGCSKDNINSADPPRENQSIALKTASGATQISGVGFYATVGECDYISQGADYAIRMTGDLQGCLYGFIDEFNCSPSGTYREEGREFFVGTYKGQNGTFWTTYKFEGKFEGCAPNGGPLGVEIFGRCQHPIVAGSGTGVFQGVSGRLDFKDDIEAGNFPYRGHLRF